MVGGIGIARNKGILRYTYITYANQELKII
jgi:hypothetical protein